MNCVIPAEPGDKTLPKSLLSGSALGGPLPARVLEDVERGVLRAIGVPIE